MTCEMQTDNIELSFNKGIGDTPDHEEKEKKVLLIEWEKLKQKEHLKTLKCQNLLKEITGKHTKLTNQHNNLMSYEEKKIILNNIKMQLTNELSKENGKEEEFSNLLDSLEQLEISTATGLHFEDSTKKVLPKEDILKNVKKQRELLETCLCLDKELLHWRQIYKKEKSKLSKYDILNKTFKVDTIIDLQEENKKSQKKNIAIEEELFSKIGLVDDQLRKIQKHQKKLDHLNHCQFNKRNCLNEADIEYNKLKAEVIQMKQERNFLRGKWENANINEKWFLNKSLLKDYENTIKEIEELNVKQREYEHKLTKITLKTRKNISETNELRTVVRPRFHRSNFKSNL